MKKICVVFLIIPLVVFSNLAFSSIIWGLGLSGTAKGYDLETGLLVGTINHGFINGGLAFDDGVLWGMGLSGTAKGYDLDTGQLVGTINHGFINGGLAIESYKVSEPSTFLLLLSFIIFYIFRKSQRAHNRVRAGFSPALPTPLCMRVRTETKKIRSGLSMPHLKLWF